MSDERKRIIEQTASTEIFDDDWFIKDSALHNTTKISQTVLKQEILKDVKGVVELTQAEYDALPSSKLTDGILYAIKDSEDIIGNIENAINTLSGDIDDLEELVSTEMYNTAPMWSTSSYTFDDLVVYGIDGRLYRCIVRNSTANQFVSSEWQATNIKAELYLLLQRIAPQFIASSQSYTQVYYKGNLVLHTNDYGVNTFYVCKQDLPQGDTEWVENHWEEVNTVSGLSKYLMDKIAEAGQIDDVQVKTTGDYESVVDENKVAKIDLSNVLIEKSVPNLPQSIATFNDGSDNLLKSLAVSIEPVQEGSGDPSPTNVRPISGWTEEVITRCGKNLFNAQDIVTKSNHTTYTYIEDGYLYYNAGDATVYGINWYDLNFPCPLTFSGSVKNFASLNENVIFLAAFDDGTKSSITITQQLPPNEEQSFSVIIGASGKKLVRLTNSWASARKLGLNLATTQLEIGSTATTYEPYNGTTTTIPFVDGQGQSVEVYGGSIECVSGALSEQFVCEKLPFSNYLTKTDLTNVTRYTYALSNEIDATDYSTQKCNMATVDASYTSDTPHFYCGNMNLGSRAYLFLPIGVESSVDVEFYYKLATPTTFYTHPTSIKSLDGDNNVFASTGDMTKLEYIANATDVIANLEARVTALENA